MSSLHSPSSSPFTVTPPLTGGDWRRSLFLPSPQENGTSTMRPHYFPPHVGKTLSSPPAKLTTTTCRYYCFTSRPASCGQ
uniref:Putative ovule protein n=1 Tax=Solanum chacoense TaxID=4108 RepID=A0A0V0IXN9_SOLCH